MVVVPSLGSEGPESSIPTFVGIKCLNRPRALRPRIMMIDCLRGMSVTRSVGLLCQDICATSLQSGQLCRVVPCRTDKLPWVVNPVSAGATKHWAPQTGLGYDDLFDMIGHNGRRKWMTDMWPEICNSPQFFNLYWLASLQMRILIVTQLVHPAA